MLKCLSLIVLTLCLAAGHLAAAPKKPVEKQPYILYGQLIAHMEVQLADGMQWHAMKGDVFPVVMFKDQQTKVVLQSGATTFRLSTDWVKTMEAKEVTKEQLAAYQQNVQNYIDRQEEAAKVNPPGDKNGLFPK